MKEIGKILVYLLCTIIVGALLAPIFYSWGQWISAQGTLAFLQKTEFQRFFNRAVLAAALFLLWPTVRWLHIKNLSELGLEKNAHPLRQLIIGFAIAACFLLLMSATLLATDVYRLRDPLPWGRLPTLLLTAATVSVLEESLFRGALQGLVARAGTRYLALNFVAALFALVHFLKPGPLHIANIEWHSGFTLIPHVFWQFDEPLMLASKCFTLFIGGWILGFARMCTRSLWMPIGLHAGWILIKMGFSKFTKRTGDLFPWFGADLFAGLGPVVVLLATGACVFWWLKYEATKNTLHHG